MQALQKEREESARLKAAQAISVSQQESLRQKLVAAEESAARAISDKTLGERRAAQQLQDAHRALAGALQVRGQVKILQHEQQCACSQVLACLAGRAACAF